MKYTLFRPFIILVLYSESFNPWLSSWQVGLKTEIQKIEKEEFVPVGAGNVNSMHEFISQAVVMQLKLLNGYH